MGRLAVSLLSPAAPEASVCSAAGIHWALEDLVASCLHHRQWHEVQARSKLAPSLFMPVCLSALARPGLLHTKSVFVTGYALCHFLTSCVYSDSQDCSCLRRAGSRPAPARARPHRAPLCLSEPVAEAAHPPPAPAHMQCGGRFPDPRFTRYTDNVTACRTRNPKLRCLPVPSGAVACSTGS